MNEGAYWVYKGQVKWTEPNSSEIREDTITWRMEIVETIESNGITAARVKGHPADLRWYEENRQPGDYLIVRKGENLYYLITEPRVEQVLGLLKDSTLMPDGWLYKSELFLDLPLSLNKAFGGCKDSYHWQVIEVDSIEPGVIRGLPLVSETRYRLALATLPDHTIVDFVPGIGITRYRYAHHGTVSEIDVKLVDFRTGSKE